MATVQDLNLLALLVHRGQIDRAAAESLLAETRSSSRSPLDLAVARGLFTRERLDFLRRVEGEDVPELPGFEPLGIAGRGGTAIVVRAKERKSGRVVAVKVLRRELEGDEKIRASFLREAKLLIGLGHPNIVHGEKVGAFQGRLVFLMEHVPGRSLLDLLKEGRTFGEDESLYLVLQVARALHYLSENGVVHRDVKPGNVLVTDQNVVKLIDLGFASSLGAAPGDGAGEAPADAPAAAPAAETTVGTVAYISPEQARGQVDLDVRSDIYSLGATLYQLVVGELPFAGDNQEMLAAQILESLSSEVLKSRRISPHMHYFIEKMMAKERDVRYQSPTELIADIEQQIRGKKSLEYRPGAPRDEELLRKPFAAKEPPRPPIVRRRRPR
jgi:serine/threonine-protein kinase